MAVAREVLLGVRLYWRGLSAWRSHPGPMWVALLPGLVTAWIFTTGLVALIVFLDPLSGVVAGWIAGDAPWRELVQVLVALGLIGDAIAFSVFAFVSVTSTIGQPAYEWVASSVDDAYGPVAPGQAEPWWRQGMRAVREGSTTLVWGAMVAVAVALAGLVPVVGAVVAWLLGATFGGWLLAIEFTSPSFERRGLTLRDRRSALAARRAASVGFGAMAFVASLAAPIAVLTMPVSYAGGVHLARLVLPPTSAGVRQDPSQATQALPHTSTA